MAHVLLLRTFKGISLFKEKKLKKKIHPPFAPPLSLLYYASVLEKNGHNVTFIEVTCEINPEEKINQIIDSCNSIIITVLPGNQYESASLSQFIKNRNPNIPIIIEGLYCTIDPINAMQIVQRADLCIRGEGEYVINDILKVFDGIGSLKDIPGIYYRKDDQIKNTSSSIPAMDLNEKPFPARHLVKQYDYGIMNGIYLCKPPFTSMITSKGCPNNCQFCNSQYINGKYRERSSENTINELKKIDYEYNSVMIEDDNFLSNKKRAGKIFDSLIREGINLEIFIAGARVDSADRELYKKMAKAGVKFISFGIESGNQEILNYYKKGVTLSQIRKAIDLSIEMNMITWGNFIFGAPIETREQLQETLEFSLSLPLDMAFYRHLSYQRGSPLWENAVTKDIITENEIYKLLGSCNIESSLTEEEIAIFCRNAFKKFYYRPSYLLQEIIRCIKRNDFTVIRSLYSAL
jgi:radical SAM superfamily enzyme YgiQ (UPF0313 family)